MFNENVIILIIKLYLFKKTKIHKKIQNKSKVEKVIEKFFFSKKWKPSKTRRGVFCLQF